MKKKDIKLPQTEDRDYLSLEHLIHHVLRAARGYIIWMCEPSAIGARFQCIWGC